MLAPFASVSGVRVMAWELGSLGGLCALPGALPSEGRYGGCMQLRGSSCHLQAGEGGQLPHPPQLLTPLVEGILQKDMQRFAEYAAQHQASTQAKA